MGIDDELRRAVTDVRRAVDEIPIPAVRPSARRAPALAMAATVVAVVVGLGWFLLDRDDGVRVVTAPGPSTTDTVTTDTVTTDPPGSSPSTSTTVPPSSTATASAPSTTAVSAPAVPATGRLTSAADGEFIVPSRGSPAWSADESMLVLHRTGSDEPGHVVVSAATGEVVADVGLEPPDIEQVYWDPLVAGRLIAFEGSALVGYDVDTLTRTTLHTVADCDRLDAGYPSPPSDDGTIAAMCVRRDDRELITLDLVTATERRAPLPADASAVFVSPRAEVFVVQRADGSVVTLDRDLAELAEIPIDGTFVLVARPDGDRIVATQYSGVAIGSVVVLDPSGLAAPQVVVGPDRGDEYPPSGAQLSGRSDRVVVATRGPVTGALAGRVVVVDLDDGSILASFEHGSTGRHEYWSEPFVSLSPSGRHVAYATDSDGDRVDTHVAALP